MKTAEELEQELIVIGRKLADITVETSSSIYNKYTGNKEFCQLIEDYKVVFEKMYAQSEKEVYYWRFCSFETYLKTYDRRVKEYFESGNTDFFFSEFPKSADYDDSAPILLMKSYDVGIRIYYNHLSFVGSYFFTEEGFQKRHRSDRNDKYEFLDAKREVYMNQAEIERGIHRNKIRKLAGAVELEGVVVENVEVNYDKQREMEDEQKAQEIKLIEEKQKARKLKLIEANVLTAKKWISALSGHSINGKKIMKAEKYVILEKEVLEMIRIETIPLSVIRIDKTCASTSFIRRLFYEIHKELYGNRSIRTYFIDYLLAKFQQFKDNEPRSLKKHFSDYPNAVFLNDFKKIMEKQKNN